MKSFLPSITLLYIFIISIAFLTIGIKGIVDQKPFLISARWMWVFMLICFSPLIFNSVSLPTDEKYFDLFLVTVDLFLVLDSLIFVVILFFMWQQTSGYLVLNVTYNSFREALHSALDTLSFPFEEQLSKIHLKEQDIFLEVSVQSCMGIGYIRVKKGSDRSVLKAIATEMNNFLRKNKVEVNLYPCYLNMIFAIMMLVAVGAVFFRSLRFL